MAAGDAVRPLVLRPCGACEEHLVQEAAREERPLLCPDCRAPVITGYQKEWPGQVIVSEGDGASICDSDD